MKINDLVERRGCFTLAKFVRGRTVAELERDLGFRSGRLSSGGAFISVIMRLPMPYEFELLGYSNVAEHRFVGKDLDANQAKNFVRTKVWSEFGGNHPVKVISVAKPVSGDNDLEYPPGWGVPQWKLTAPMRFKIVAFVKGGERAYW